MLVRVWDIVVAWAVACAVSPVTFGLSATVQVWVVPVGTMVIPPFVGKTVNAEPLQVVAVWAGITGLGLTVTVTENGVPAQVPERGVAV